MCEAGQDKHVNVTILRACVRASARVCVWEGWEEGREE